MKVISKTQELRDVTITHVSYVKRGANKKQFLLAKSDEGREPDVEFDVRVIKDDNSTKQLLYGIVYEPDVADAHGDLMKSEEIEKTAHEFMTYYRNIDSEHNLMAGAGLVVESYIAPVDMEINGSVVKSGSWVLVTKATDEIWQDYVNGDITGYSMFGIARTAIVKTEEPKEIETETTWIQKALEKIGILKSFEETVNTEIDRLKTSPYFIMDMLREDYFSKIDWNQMDAEKLSLLSTSMKEATSYIDGLGTIDVSKSEEAEQTETSIAGNDGEQTTTEPVIEPETQPDTQTIDETKKEPEVVEELSPEIVALKKSIEDSELEKTELANKLKEAQELLAKSQTKSAVEVGQNIYNQVKKAEPQLLF